MKIYTKTGDDGTTGLLGPGRLAKNAPRIEAYGSVDELNAALGLARTHGLDETLDRLVSRFQDELFALGAALADPDPNGRFHHAISNEHITRLESEIDLLESGLPPLTQFVLPAGCAAACALHLARTVCRRAERRVTALMSEPGEHVAPACLVYLNRLSDLLFVMSRAANAQAGVADVPWRGI